MVDGAGFRLVTSSRSRPQAASSRPVKSGTLGSRSVTRVGPATATHDRAVDPDVVECDRLVERVEEDRHAAHRSARQRLRVERVSRPPQCGRRRDYRIGAAQPERMVRPVRVDDFDVEAGNHEAGVELALLAAAARV